MEKERKASKSNPIVVVDGNVKWSKIEKLFQDFKGDIVIRGNLILEECSHIICDNIYIMGNIWDEYEADLIVEGNLYVEGAIDCWNLTVNGAVNCNKCINTYEINVAEDLYSKSKIDAGGCDINVGGDLVCKSEVAAADIRVLGKFYVSSLVEADSIMVG